MKSSLSYTFVLFMLCMLKGVQIGPGCSQRFSDAVPWLSFQVLHCTWFIPFVCPYRLTPSSSLLLLLCRSLPVLVAMWCSPNTSLRPNCICRWCAGFHSVSPAPWVTCVRCSRIARASPTASLSAVPPRCAALCHAVSASRTPLPVSSPGLSRRASLCSADRAAGTHLGGDLYGIVSALVSAPIPSHLIPQLRARLQAFVSAGNLVATDPCMSSAS